MTPTMERLIILLLKAMLQNVYGGCSVYLLLVKIKGRLNF